jgi:hypothetical protein
MSVEYIEGLLREWNDEGARIRLEWDATRRQFHAEAHYDGGEMVSADSLTLEGALDGLNDLCQEFLSEYS